MRLLVSWVIAWRHLLHRNRNVLTMLYDILYSRRSLALIIRLIALLNTPGCWIFLIQEISAALQNLKQGIEELRRSRTFKYILATLLSIGNSLNNMPVSNELDVGLQLLLIFPLARKTARVSCGHLVMSSSMHSLKHTYAETIRDSRVSVWDKLQTNQVHMRLPSSFDDAWGYYFIHDAHADGKRFFGKINFASPLGAWQHP